MSTTDHLPMLQACEKCAAGGTPADELWLEYDQRKRGRLKAVTAGGRAIGLFLPRGEALRDGELLRCESGELIAVRAAPEAVATASTDDPLLLARACYHLGNRHVPLQIAPGRVRFQCDAVLEDLARHLGLTVLREDAPFHPEAGAYHGQGGHGHHHGDGGRHHHHGDHEHG